MQIMDIFIFEGFVQGTIGNPHGDAFFMRGYRFTSKYIEKIYAFYKLLLEVGNGIEKFLGFYLFAYMNRNIPEDGRELWNRL